MYLSNRFRGIDSIDAFAKKMARGVSVIKQKQQQLSIEILTNLSINRSSINTRYYRKSAALKQKARTRSRYVLL